MILRTGVSDLAAAALFSTAMAAAVERTLSSAHRFFGRETVLDCRMTTAGRAHRFCWRPLSRRDCPEAHECVGDDPQVQLQAGRRSG
jgi:hypothetical protein